MKELKVLDENNLQLQVMDERLGVLTTNAEQIRDLVKSRINDYSIDNYDESNIDKAKSDKALLNKAKKALNDERIKLEKSFMQPFMAFKDVVNETVKIIDTAVKNIDTVVKASEEKAKVAKKEQIEHLAESLGVEEAGIKLDKIWNDKWLNKTTTMKSIQKDIESALDNIKKDLETLKSFKEDYDVLAVRYKENLDINETIAYANSLIEQRKKNHKQAETEIESDDAVSNNRTKKEEDSAFDAFNDALGQGVTPLKQDKVFVITGTEDEIAKVVDFLEENNITFNIK